ncbi:MAG: hypothetical protein JXB42_12415 [Deltaproteobacteria bacterium]|nr:hypothetical protein [Deltaproteobacteria bacterium]
MRKIVHYGNNCDSFDRAKGHVKKRYERIFGSSIGFGAGWTGVKELNN